jgi:hypothetical protein
MKRTLQLACLMMAVFVTACTREYPCAVPYVTPQFIGFTTIELDTVIVRKYPKGGNWQTVIDSVVWVLGQNAQAQIFTDSVIISPTLVGYYIHPDFDWQIELPSLSRQFWIDQITYTPITKSCGYGIFSMDKMGCACISPLVSARLNNRVITFNESTVDGRFLNISR